MSRPSRMLRAEPAVEPTPGRAVRADTRLVEVVNGSDGAEQAPTTLADALVRMEEAEDTLRAIAAGGGVAFVVSDGGSSRRVFTLSTADRPYRMFIENMRNGAATLSSTGVVLYANRRLADLLSRSREEIVGSPLAMFLSGLVPMEEMQG